MSSNDGNFLRKLADFGEEEGYDGIRLSNEDVERLRCIANEIDKLETKEAGICQECGNVLYGDYCTNCRPRFYEVSHGEGQS